MKMNCKFYISLGSSKVEISKSNCIDNICFC
nr:MAG TPA: hypothetical protein [Caudoviricetes sp.]